MATGPDGFWRRALDIVLGGESLEEGSCTGPFTLEDVAKRIGVESYSAPRLVSIDTLNGLPQALRSRGLYVVRLGQYHEGRVGARFVLCRAEGGIQSAGIGLEDIRLLASRSLLRVDLPPGLRAVTRLLSSSEAAGGAAAQAVVEALEDGGRVYAFPSFRTGSVSFDVIPERRARSYTYRGQVEVDVALVSGNNYYAVEVKKLRDPRDKLLKHKLSFSALALSRWLGEKVKPVLVLMYGGRAYVGFVEPAAEGDRAYPVWAMRVTRAAVVELS